MGSRSIFRPALIALTAFACIVAASPFADAQTPKRGGTLRVAYGNEISGLDFHTTPGYEMIWVATNASEVAPAAVTAVSALDLDGMADPTNWRASVMLSRAGGRRGDSSVWDHRRVASGTN
jgi:ABC-type transport system substrate-binding protein